MTFKPYNNTVLLRRINRKDSLEDLGGLFLKTSKIDLYEVIDVSSGNESKAFPFKIGDIVTACATGTDLKDDAGNEFILMNANYVTAKVLD